MKRLLIGLLVAAQAWTAVPAFASARGSLNTAGLLSGLALYSWYNYGRHHSAGHRNMALLSTAGAAYAWSRYSRAKRTQRRRDMARAYATGYSRAAYRPRYGGSSYRSYYVRRGSHRAVRSRRRTVYRSCCR